VKYREIIADNLSKAGWSWGCVSAVDSYGRRTICAAPCSGCRMWQTADARVANRRIKACRQSLPF